jgi:hypothetical protein
VLFMIIERFRNQDAKAVYARFREHGRLAPEGLAYVGTYTKLGGRMIGDYRAAGITKAEIEAFSAVMDFIHHPVKYGCTIVLGDAETYDERVGWVFSAAEAALAAIQKRR